MPTVPETPGVRETDKVLYSTPTDRAIVDAHLEAMGTCIWPKCTNFKAEDTHLCVTHVRKTHTFYDDNNVKTHTPGYIKRQHQFKSAQTLKDFKAGKKLEDLNQHIYIIKAGGLIKIGFSRNVRRRLRQYTPGTEVLAVAPGSPSIEKYLHRKFAHLLDSGREWFKDSEPIRTLVKELNDMYGPPAADIEAGPAEWVSPQERQYTEEARQSRNAFNRFNRLPSWDECRAHIESLDPSKDK